MDNAEVTRTEPPQEEPKAEATPQPQDSKPAGQNGEQITTASAADDRLKAVLGEQTSFAFDQKLKQWVPKRT